MLEHASNFNEWSFVVKRRLRKILPTAFLNLYFSSYPFIGNLFFGQPSRKIKLIAITGTDGKSSSVIFTARILKEAGYKVGFFSSISYSDGNQEHPNNFKMTMPGRLFLQKFLKRLVDNKCDFGVIEVTSEGIKQRRHLFIDFDIALITNIKPEHIESHGNFENYKQAKSTIFRNLAKSYRKNIPKTIIVNNDDSEAKTFLSFDAEQKVAFGIQEKADIQGQIINTDLFQNTFRVEMGGQSATFEMMAGGPFITENALAAIAVAKVLKITLVTCLTALKKITNPPGRFEIVSKKPIIIVDYAHTIVAVEKILLFVRKNWHGKIVHVFGAAGGGRDKWKRPRLGELSEQYTDFSILAEENSFDEPTANVLNDIYGGFKNKDRVAIVTDRKEADQKAVEMQMDSNDTLLLLTGKGCETVIVGPLSRKTPYNEKQTILCLLSNY
ncbi:MAG: UDP-N-acetylmuramyl-tripeptide synthetase [Candidatus Taylorbacteria bacterium]|nr:UDP-N-acetylmuramyl-tripeptide synthetase [Candidatus Taylorbacteria bacterium]